MRNIQRVHILSIAVFFAECVNQLVLKTVADFFLRNTVLFLGLKPVGDLLEVATRATVP